MVVKALHTRVAAWGYVKPLLIGCRDYYISALAFANGFLLRSSVQTLKSTTTPPYVVTIPQHKPSLNAQPSEWATA